MAKSIKDWLVRTRNGEVLGPFSERELLQALQDNLFTPQDEIAQSQNRWLSAQSLTTHDTDEFTLTHTRNQTATTKSEKIDAQTPPLFLDQSNPAHVRTDESPLPLTSESEENLDEEVTVRVYSAESVESVSTTRKVSPKFKGIFIVSVGLAGAALLWNQWRSSEQGSYRNSNVFQDNDSTFMTQIYDQIRSGESQKALRGLSQYHEKTATKSNPNLEYLIPLSALLIVEEESPARARKYLEQVLKDPNATRILKAQAHLWLGYLLLSEGEEDHGEGHFLEALQLNPKNAASCFNLGRAYLKQRRFSEALDYLGLTEVPSQDNWLIEIYRGRVKAAMGKMDEARTAFQKAVENAPDRWLTHLYYAIFLSAIKEYDRAQGVMRKMLLKDPQYEIHSPPPLGFFQEHVSYSEYLDTYLEIMDSAQTESRELGRLYLSYLMSNSAHAESRKLEMFAEKRGGTVAKILALKVKLDREEGAKSLKQALLQLPTNLKEFGPFAFVLRGEAKSRLGMVLEAQQDFQMALTLDARSAIAHWSYANLLKQNKNPKEAEDEIQNLLNQHPNYIPAIIWSRNFDLSK